MKSIFQVQYKKIIIVLCIVFTFFKGTEAFANGHPLDNHLFKVYPMIIEKLLFYKLDKFKVFYGGPVNRKEGGVQWMLPIVFEDENYKTRSVFEASFINCNLDTAQDAEIFVVSASDINIKFKNQLTKEYNLFKKLMSGKYKFGKYIVIRQVDVAMVYYPDFYMNTTYGNALDSDLNTIMHFLHRQLGTQKKFSKIGHSKNKNHIESQIVQAENEREIEFKPVQVATLIEDKLQYFWVTQRIIKDDPWKLYYIISNKENNVKNSIKNKTENNNDVLNSNILLRLDTGCVSGQIYDDDACDCLEQLHEGLKKMSEDKTGLSMIIHIPAHDGRGFGTAPKAETEIYKRGGAGRAHATKSLDTIEAAKLLYGHDLYDLRTFEGAAKVLKSMGIQKVTLLTDNVHKVKTLQSMGIEVTRQKTNTHKESCVDHLKAKKESSSYFKD